jgi:hypothetical protein
MLLHVPSLGWGFLWDDFMHQAVFRYGGAIPQVSRLNLYDYGRRPRAGEPLGNLGLYPWWTSENFRARFFRPVTSLTLFSDYLVYRDWSPGYHLTSIFAFGALLAIAYRLYRKLGASRTAATWALGFLALEDIHVVPVGWIANRNALLADFFVVATLLCVDRYYRTRHRWVLAGAVLAFLLGCGSKETALTAAALVPLYVWTVRRPPGRETLMQTVRRVLATGVVWLFAALAALYTAGYVLAGYGLNSALYATPWQALGAFARRLTTFVPLAGASLFFGVSTDVVFIDPGLASTLAVVVAPLVALLGWIMWHHLRAQPLAGFATGWMLIALAPAAGVTTSDRLLVDATLGSALLLGLLVTSLRAEASGQGPSRAWRSVAVGVLIFCGPVMSLPMTWIRGSIFFNLAAADRRAIMTADVPVARGTARQVFLLDPPSTILALTAFPTWAVLHSDPGASFYSLQMARRPWTWRREGDRAVVMSFGPPPLLDQRYERLFRTAFAPPPAGTVFETAAFTATVLEVDAQGIREARLDFHRPLADPAYRFLLWQDGALQATEFPPIGETVHHEPARPIYSFAP